MSTATAGAQDPVAMAEAMKLAVRAGRLAYRAGRIPPKLHAKAEGWACDSRRRSRPGRKRLADERRVFRLRALELVGCCRSVKGRQ